MDGQRDSDLFKTAIALVDGNASESLIREAIERISSTCGFSKTEAMQKVDSALNRSERKHTNLAEEIREWVLSTNGLFLSSDVHKCMQLSTRQDLKNCSGILSRLCETKVIERDSKVNGKWRKIDNDELEMDIMGEDEKHIDIWLPCNLHNLVGLCPKNIMVIAGVSNTGKTAWLLNIARKNRNVYYFNSEMDLTELKRKLDAFPGGRKGFAHVSFMERNENYSDVIRPDAINIVDYLEIYEDHFKMGKHLRDIHDKLNNGVAIIAIQKDPTKVYGQGGNVTVHKSRIYLNLDEHPAFNIGKIVKGKNWKTDINPNYLEIKYRIKNKGVCIDPGSDWLRGGVDTGYGVFDSGNDATEWDLE